MNEEQGWIKLHRRLIDWEWYKDANVFRVFIHLVLKANHEDRQWQGIVIKRGERVTSIDNLSEEVGLTPMQIRTAITKLKRTGEITSRATNKYSVVTVAKYNEYQVDNKQDNKRITSKQQADNKQITTNKNEKNDKNISKDIGAKAPEYGNSDITKLIKRINKELEVKLPEDGRARMTVHNMLKLLTKSKTREWEDEDKWVNAKNWFVQYYETKLSKGYYPQSWFKVYDNLKLWIANEGDLSKLNKDK